MDNNQELSREEIVELVIKSAKEKFDKLIVTTDFMTEGSESLIEKSTNYLNEVKDNLEKQESSKANTPQR